MTGTLEVREVTKRFGGMTAVDRASFQVSSGEIMGFIGPNGAGKTTTMRICATLEMPDEGDVFIDGISVLDDPRRARRRMGFMPDSYGAYANTIVSEFLDFYARAYGLRGRDRRRMLEYVMDFTSLDDLANKEISALSKGMGQRLCLAKTLLHDPQVMILDEPAAGLDPRARVELRELVKALAGMGKAILISSHILTELSEMVDGVAVIEQGVVRATGSVADVVRGVRKHLQIFVRTLAPLEETERALLEQPGVQSVHGKGAGLLFELDGEEDLAARVLAELVRRDLSPVEFAPRGADLEDVFLSLTEGLVQ